MNYGDLIYTIQPKVLQAVALVNNPEIVPEVRQRTQEILLRQVGQTVYAKIYDMNAFDMEIMHTTGPGIDDRYYGLAKVASGSISTGTLGLEEYINNYLLSVSAKAQADAFKNAKQSGKRPTLDRRIRGEKTCDWCLEKQGHWEDPSDDKFHRHGGCDCELITSGYNSRNGLLENYKPRKAAAK